MAVSAERQPLNQTPDCDLRPRLRDVPKTVRSVRIGKQAEAPVRGQMDRFRFQRGRLVRKVVDKNVQTLQAVCILLRFAFHTRARRRVGRRLRMRQMQRVW